MNALKVNFFGVCPICGCGDRGTDINSLQCSNTNCYRNMCDIINDEFCKECNKNIYQSKKYKYCNNKNCKEYIKLIC